MKCNICNQDFDNLNKHIKEHNILPKDYYEKYVIINCKYCSKRLPYIHSLNRSLYREFCNRSCQVSYRNLQASKLGINPFQKQNLVIENGRSIRHVIGHQSAMKSGKFNWMNTGTKECIERLSEMHKLTADHQIENGNSVFSTQFHSSKEELKFGESLTEFGIEFIPQYHDSRWSKRYKADYYLTKFNIIIEIDGDFKYDKFGILDQKYIDREILIFKESNIKIIHIKASQVNSITKDLLLNMISQKLND